MIRRLLAGFVVALIAPACSSGGGADKSRESTKATTALYSGFTSDTYSDAANWICRPDTEDICDAGLDTTLIEADGTLEEEPWKAAENPPIDCFYIYPTISQDQSGNSDLNWSEDEEGLAVLNQVARLGVDCRVFAPVYRSSTLTALVGRISGSTDAPTADPEIAYGDVVDAWKQYIAHDNDGRGVVILGHSQGAGLANRLIREEIDPNPDARELLVSTFLAGSTVRVPEGKDVGGDFKNVPLCRSPEQTGCVVSWASFRATSPPPAGTYFGVVRGGDGVAACTNPAALGGERATLDSYFPTRSGSGIFAAVGVKDGGQPWVDPTAGAVSTPFVATPGLVDGECVTRNGANVLEITVNGDPSDPRRDDITGDITPEWGLHLIDMNLVMGDIVGLVATQAEAYGSR